MEALAKRTVDWDTELDNFDLDCPACEGAGHSSHLCTSCDGTGRKTEDEPCEDCQGCGEIDDDDCEGCAGTGKIDTVWNTIWNLGLRGEDALSREQRAQVLKETSCFVAWNNEDQAWYLGLTGCGQDLTPHMAKALLICDFKWIPLDWAYDLVEHLGERYIRGEIGQEWFEKVQEALVHTVDGLLIQANRMRETMATWTKGDNSCA